MHRGAIEVTALPPMNYAVIIPCHNSGPQLIRTVHSALDQTLPPAEVVCIDDRSSDGTWATIGQLARDFPGRVRGAKRPEDAPLEVRSFGIRSSAAEWFALLDHDDLWLPRKMELQAALAPRAKFLCSALYEETDDDPATRALIDRGRLLTCNDPFRVLFHRIAIVPCTAIIHRDALDRVGMFSNDPATRWAGDVEMWLRLSRHGFDPAWHADPLAIRRIHGANMSHNPAPGLQAWIHMLEAYRRDDPEAVARVGGPVAARRALHWRRLELAGALIAAGEPAGAREQLDRVWREGWSDPLLWRFWRKRAGRGIDDPILRREIRRTFKALRRWCTGLLARP